MKIITWTLAAIFFLTISLDVFCQSKDKPIKREVPEIPVIDGTTGYREIFIFQDSTKNFYQELQLFLSNYYKSAKDVIDLTIDLNDKSAGIIIAKAKFQVPTYGYNVLGKKYYQNLLNYTVDHQVTFEIKGNRVRTTLNNFMVQEPPLEYTALTGTSRIDYPKRTIQEMIEFCQLSFLESSLEGRINISKQYAYSDFLNSFDVMCKGYLKEVEKYLNQQKDDW